MKFNKKVVIIIPFVFILTFIIFTWSKMMTAKFNCDKCNVVLISIDTLSALHLPCYGYERNTAPNLCKYADENINFLNSYSQSPITLSSYFSIFTSLYPHTHEMIDINGGSLNENYLTLAQLYKMNGYETFFYGPSDGLHIPLNRGIERGFDFLNGKHTTKNEENWNEVYQRLVNNTNKMQPSFFFLHTYAVHEPYLTGHEPKHLFTNLPEYPNIPLTQEEHDALTPDFFSFIVRQNAKSDLTYTSKLLETDSHSDKDYMGEITQAENLQKKISIFNTLSIPFKYYLFMIWNQSKINTSDPNQIAYLRALYDEQIYNMDQNLGKFLKLLDDPKLAKNTIIAITADHGKEFMEHGKLYQGYNIFRTFTQVPLIMHIPGIAPKKIPELVQGIDIYPTVISLTNIVPKSTIEGINLTGLIKSERNAPTNTYIRSEWDGVTAIQSQNLRYYYNESTKSPIGLYNLAADPGEQNNIKDSSPVVISKFKKMLKI